MLSKQLIEDEKYGRITETLFCNNVLRKNPEKKHLNNTYRYF